MTRLSSVFWVLLVSATALATYAIKYQVQTLDDRLADARKATASEEAELRVLNAEWAYLNRPDMLAAMNQRFLALAPIATKQLQTAIADIPMRPAPPPPAPPEAADTGPVAALDAHPPEDSSPAAPASPDRIVSASLDKRGPERLAAPERLEMASASVKPLLVKAAAHPGLSEIKPLDSRSLDQLIARIAAGR